MHTEGVERVVIAKRLLTSKTMNEQKKPGDQADEQRGEGLHEAGSRGDRDQSCNGSRDGAQRGWLAVMDPLGDGPAQGGRGGCKVGVDESAGGQRAGASALPALNPNHPTQSRHAPIKLSTMECGGMSVCGYPTRLPR